MVVDQGPGIRATLANNPNLDVPDIDAEAIRLVTQELVSGTGDGTRGIRLWMILNEMPRPSRKLLIHSGGGQLVTYGAGEPEVREAKRRRGTPVRLMVPARRPGCSP